MKCVTSGFMFVACACSLACEFEVLPPIDQAGALFQSIVGQQQPMPSSVSRPSTPEEPNLSNIHQLTFGGQNAEAYWDVTGTKLTYQSRQPQWPDEQILTMNADGSEKTLMSTGLGRCTCSYFTPDGKYLYFSSTYEKNPGAQAPLDMSKGYVWKVNPQFSLYRVNVEKGPDSIVPVIKKREYIAETTISPDSKFMTFTGLFDGDLDIYRSNMDGTDIRRLTDEYGYDGGPFISWDSKKIVYRRGAVDTDAERKDYLNLLKQNLVRPGKLEIWVMDADGSNKRQITHLGAASFAPFIHPDGKRVIFSSNYGDPNGREFDLFMIDLDGKNLKRITHTPEFDGFPMFTRDGKKLVWASNRFGTVRGETNIFVCDWKELDHSN